MNILTHVKNQAGFVSSVLKTQQNNWVYSLSTRLIIICFIVSVSIILWKWNRLPPQVPLWYSRAWGNDRLAPTGWLFLLPGMSLFWHALNIILSIYVSRNHYIFSQVLFVASLFVAVFSLIAVVSIVFLVT
jgi:hypothetical protein